MMTSEWEGPVHPGTCVHTGFINSSIYSLNVGVLLFLRPRFFSSTDLATDGDACSVW